MKNPDLTTKRGTIANLLSKNKEELFELINLDEYQKLQIRVNELLNDDSIKNNPAVVEAKMNLSRHANKKNLYYSILMTYLTGMKVS